MIFWALVKEFKKDNKYSNKISFKVQRKTYLLIINKLQINLFLWFESKKFSGSNSFFCEKKYWFEVEILFYMLYNNEK